MDTMFNESFATAVERIGSARWIAARASPAAAAEYAALDERRRDFRELTLRTRRARRAVRQPGERRQARRQGRRCCSCMRDEYALLRDGRAVLRRLRCVDGARQQRASLAVLTGLHRARAALRAPCMAGGRDMARFYAAVRKLAEMPGTNAGPRSIDSEPCRTNTDGDRTMADIRIRREHKLPGWHRRARSPGSGPRRSSSVRHGVRRDRGRGPATPSSSGVPASTAS